MELLTTAKRIKEAKCPEDVFGGPADGSTIMSTYRQLILVIHPDHFEDKPKEFAIANEAFKLLTALRGDADRKVKAGTYGKRKVKAPPPKEPFRPSVIEAKGKKYILVDQLAVGDIADIFLATVTNGSAEHKVVFKLVKNGVDNDLLENEAKVLEKLYPPSAKDEKFYRFLPKVENTFIVRGPGYQRRVNILPWFQEHRGFDEILRVFPDGIDFRDMVWMFKRILHGVGFAHEKKIVHGALIPPHVMIHPVSHGAKLIAWSYAIDLTPKDTTPRRGGRGALFDHLVDDDLVALHVKAISTDYRAYYPPEILKKLTPTPAADLYMAAKCAVALVGGDVKTNAMPKEIPPPVRAFFENCLHVDPTKRPQNAWDAHETLDKLLLKTVGKRAYRPFPMPEVHHAVV